MPSRKVIFWERQGVVEAFDYDKRVGWFEADHSDWPVGSYKFYAIHATQDEFDNRVNGMIQI